MKTQNGSELTGTEMAQMLEEFLNTCGPGRLMDEFATQLVERTHPTLQQNAMKLFMRTIKKWAEQKFWDDRNAATIKLARGLEAEARRWPGLPMI